MAGQEQEDYAEAPLDAERVWCETRRSPLEAPRPALFLDRDGTLIELEPYLSEPGKVRPIAGAGRMIARANAIGLPVIVITNQSGIDRGYYGWAAFAAVQRRLEFLIGAEGARFDAVYACPHLPGGRAGEQAPGSLYRKPGPGMLLRAAEVLNLDLRRSWVVGDAASDLEAGLRAGLCRGWLVPTGYGARDAEAARSLTGAGFEVVVGRPIEALIGELDDLAAAL